MVKQTFLGKFMDGLSYMRSNDQITSRVMGGGGEFLNFTNAFSSNLNTSKLKLYHNHKGILT